MRAKAVRVGRMSREQDGRPLYLKLDRRLDNQVHGVVAGFVEEGKVKNRGAEFISTCWRVRAWKRSDRPIDHIL
jgi:hypothetical protein